MAEILVEFGAKGAGFVIDEIRKVEKSVDQLRSNMKAPLGMDLNAGMFSTKAMNDATGAMHHMGIEYEKLRGKMKSPLMPPSSGDFTKQFSTRAIDDLNKKLKGTAEAAKGAGFELGFMTRIIAAMGVRALAREVFSLADGFTKLQNKLKTVTSPDSLPFISKELFNIAQESRTSLESIVTAYSRTTRSVKGLGKTQQEVLQFTETLSKAIQVGGSTSVEAGNAMIQLSQGMGSGALKGDELRSVLEQLPIVAQLIADKMGVSVSSLRMLGSEGKLTTDVVFDAIIAGTTDVEAKMASMDLTVGQAWTRLKNQATVSAEAMGGAMKFLSNSIQTVTNNFNLFVTSIISLGAASGVWMAIKGIRALDASMIALRATMVAHPILAIASVLAVATAALAPFVAQMKITSDATATFGDVWSAAWQEMKYGWDTLFDGTTALGEAKKEMEGLSENTEKWLVGLATAADIITAIIPGINVMKLVTAAVTDQDYFTMFQDKVKNINKRVNMNAAADITDKMIKDEQMVLGKDLSQGTALDLEIEYLDREREQALALAAKLAGEKKKKGRGGDRDRGKTVGELLEEAQFDFELGGINDVDANIIKGMKKAIDSLKPSIRKAIEEGSTAYDSQLSQLNEILRQEEARRIHANDAIEQEKERAKALEEQLQLVIKEEEERRKILLHQQKEGVKESHRRREQDQRIAEELNPDIQKLDKIRELEAFIDRYKDFPEWVDLAKEKVDQLKLSLQLGQAGMIFSDQFESMWGVGGSFSKGLSDIAAKAIVMNLSLRETKDLLRDLALSLQQQALSSLFQLGINSAIGALGSAISPSASSLPGGLTGPNGKPTNIEVVGSYHTQDYDVPGYSRGGYTGSSPVDKAAGIVHGQEFVINADATRQHRPMLEAINKGGSVPQMQAAKVTVHNYAGVQVETGITQGEVQVMISKAIRDQAPGIMAQQINNPSSQISRSLSKNLTSERRRI